MGELHALGAGRRTARVVDRRGRVLIYAGPRLGLAIEAEQRLVALRAEQDAVLRRDVGQRLVDLRINEQDRRPGVLDDVLDLLRPQPEVDRHQDPTGGRYGVEQLEHAGCVRRDHRDPLADVNAELVEAGLERATPASQRRVGDGAE